MRRIEFMGHRRKTPMQSRNAADAIMLLAQISLERRRLEQERSSLEKRLRRIDGRLHMIAGAETRLLPAIHVAATPQTKPNIPIGTSTRQGFAEVVVQY